MRILKITSDKFGIYMICRTLFTYQMVRKNKIKHEIVIPVFLFRHFLRQYLHTRCHSSLLCLSQFNFRNERRIRHHPADGVKRGLDV